MNCEPEKAKDFTDGILREQVRLAMNQLPTMQTASFVVALVLAYLVRDTAPQRNILVWLVLILFVVASRIVFYFQFVKVREEPFIGEQWKKVYLALALVSGLCWGLSAFLIFPAGDLGLISLFVLVMASLSAATTVSHSSIRLGPTAWAAPAMLLYAIRCILDGGQSEYTVGFLIVLYLATILRYSFSHNRAITSAISLKFENMELLDEVREARDLLEKKVEERTVQLQRANESLTREIEERSLLADALLESQERFRELAELLPETIFEMDTEGNLTFVNQNAFDHFGYSQEDLEQGLNGFDIIDSEDRTRARENAAKIINGEKLGLIEYRALRKDGSAFPVIIHTAAKVHEGKTLGLRGIVIDVTETKKLEAQLRQAHKMEAIGTLAGGIAHDFNNILAAIIGYTEMAQIDFPEWSTTYQDLEQVLKSSYRARDLVKQILTFSRMKGDEESIVLNMGRVVRESAKMLRASIPATIEMQLNISCEDCVISADPTQIHQILMNLCTNAAHAMREEGGELKISLDSIEVSSEGESTDLDLESGPYVRLVVSDTGHGMDAASMERIFEPYFTTKEVGEGSGLGLAVIHGIVKRYQGAITARSEPGKGTAFYVYLPRITAHPEGQHGTDSSILEGSERILFVDDEEAIVNLGRRILEQLGYRVVAKTNSKEALDVFCSNPHEFDLLITDFTMPRMTGGQLAREVLRIRPEIPILMCTGFNEQISEERTRSMGISGLIMKPLNRRQMAEAVRSVLKRE